MLAVFLVLVLVTVCVVLAWSQLRKNRKLVATNSRGLWEFNNALYGEGELQSQWFVY